MHSQGEHIRTWRKRWFVLKQVCGGGGQAGCVACAGKPGVAAGLCRQAGMQAVKQLCRLPF
jgi:hypothetical protein